MTHSKRRIYKIRDRVLFESFDHGEIIGHVDHVGSDILRISYISPVTGDIEYENIFTNCTRIKNGWVYI